VTFDLDAARALHDRDPQEPGNCISCRYDNTPGYTGWPCPTATALGATGRTEWDGPPNGFHWHTFDPKPTPDALSDTLLEAMSAVSAAGTGTLYVPKIIEYDPATEHITATGVAPRPDAYTTCGAYETPGDIDYPCILITEHYGPHIDRDGDMWDNPDDPELTTPWLNAEDPCRYGYVEGREARSCVFANDHLGDHYYVDVPTHEECTPSTCPLPKNHSGQHRTIEGATL
jgi:hypothetical protein